MQKIAVTGCTSRFARVLLPLLDNDPNIEQIIGIDLVQPAATYKKLVFHKQDVRDPAIKETLNRMRYTYSPGFYRWATL